MYRSKFEARCAKQLKGFAYEPIRLPYSIEHHYIPDFVCTQTKTIVEAKGRFRPGDRAKLLAVKRAHPSWHFVLWFQDPNLLISKTSKTTYAQWARRNGFNVLP